MFSQASVILFTGCVYPSMQWGRPPRADTAPPLTTAVDGTHPTGMHSCFEIFLNEIRGTCNIPQNEHLINITGGGTRKIKYAFCCSDRM